MKKKILIIGLFYVFGFSFQGSAQDIFQAIQKGDIEQVKTLLTQNKDAINNQDRDKDTPLHHAAQLGNEEIAGLLISTGASLIIFTSRGRSEGSGLFISFTKDNGNWTKAKSMGETFGADALLTTISPDGKYLFFTGRKEGRKGVFWVDAKIIEELKGTE